MKLDRNIDGNEGHGKYAILNLRQLALCEDVDSYNRFEGRYTAPIQAALALLEENGILDWGVVGSRSEFFLIKLKDHAAACALAAYADDYEQHDPEWAAEVRSLSQRSGPHHPLCKRAD